MAETLQKKPLGTLIQLLGGLVSIPSRNYLIAAILLSLRSTETGISLNFSYGALSL